MWERKVHINRLIHIDAIVTAFTVKRQKNYLFHGEAHDFWELVYISESTAGFTADGKVFECSQGSIVFHKPNEFHRIWNVGNEAIKFTVISFSSNSEYLTNNLSNVITILSRKGRTLMSDLQALIEKSGELRDYLPSDFHNNNNPVAIAEFSNILELLLYECAKSKDSITPITNTDAKLFASAVNKMKEYIDQPVKTQQIADDLNVSLSHLKRVFNRYAMTGIHEYFLSIKIERAKILLSQGEPVYMVATKVGFYNQNYFSAAFKRITGATPTKWLKTLEYSRH